MTIRVLGLDAATDACSAALLVDGRVAGRRFAVIGRGHAEALMPMVEGALADADTAYGDIDLIAVTVGPGAFTGIRIGLAAARGLALALNRPCFGVTTLESIAWAVPERMRAPALLVAIESKRADVFAQLFATDLVPIAPPAALPPERLPAMITGLSAGNSISLAGDGAERAERALVAAGFAVHLADAPRHPDAASVAALAAERWRTLGRPVDIASPRPLYLRAPDTTVPRLR